MLKILCQKNKILEVHLSLDESLFDGDKIVWSSSFVTCCHEGGHDCHRVVLRSDYYCDMTGG